MKKFLFIALIALFVAVSSSAKTVTAVFAVSSEMTSKTEATVKKKLKADKGVASVVTNLSAKTVTVTYDADKTNPAAIQKSLKNAGCPATLKTSKKQAEAPVCDGCGKYPKGNAKAACPKNKGGKCLKL